MQVKKDIQFSLYCRGKQLIVDTYLNEFADLRVLIMAKLHLDFFGECGGMGRCVTCLVNLNSDKDEEFACQIPINYSLHNCTIKLIGDRLVKS